MTNKAPIDYLIIGQGLAGTLITRLLLKAGKTVKIIDAAHSGSSTKLAAGIVNPVTGRRFAKSWLFHELFPVAKQMYQEIELETGLELFHPKKIIRVLTTAEQENEWFSRSSWPEMQNHMAGPPKEFPCQKQFKSVFSLATTLGGAQVNIASLIRYYQKIWLEQGLLTHQNFEYDQINISPEGVRYQDIHAKQVIFCEGHAVAKNPWFGDLPWNFSKGEVLHLRIPGYTTNHIVKHHLLYAPLGPDHYWVGSNYEWNSTNDKPTESGKNWLLKRIDKGLSGDYEIIDHQAAIRPTVEDRRPLIGRHAVYPQLILFNGLGTKGTSLGPYFAQELVAHLLYDTPLNEEADLKRVR